MTTNAAAIAAQNDQFRRYGPTQALPGRFVMTAGIAALPYSAQMCLSARMRGFDAFTPDNDSYGEHDFGAIEVDGAPRVFWKIDYYADDQFSAGAEDPLACARVLTLMLASEY